MLRKDRVRRAVVLVVGLGLGLQAAGSGLAGAEESPSLTLEASRTLVTFGQGVVLSGHISSEVAGEIVSIASAAGNVVKQTTTNEGGAYSVSFRPRYQIRLHARWNGARSEGTLLRVRPRLRTGVSRVRLFDRALVTGSVAPAHSGGSVTVELYRWGKRVRRRNVRLRDGRYFRAPLYIARPGRYRARVVFHGDDDHLWAARWSVRRTTPLPSLSLGNRNIFVKLLERRLSSLRYHLKGVDRRYRRDTADAVRAFNKVQGRARLGSVNASTWRALVSPRRPRPRRAFPYRHIEVDQTKQVLYKIRGGKVRAILHVSTGRNGSTHDGTYRVYRKLAGYSPGRLYYPSYFHGLRAIHGWRQVPTYPASHGCVRVPMWAAKWIYRFAKIGRRVIIYH